MAEKRTETVKNTECCTVEHLQAELQMPDAIHEGICTQMGWGKGREVTKKEYEAAADMFRGAVAGRRRHA